MKIKKMKVRKWRFSDGSIGQIYRFKRGNKMLFKAVFKPASKNCEVNK